MRSGSLPILSFALLLVFLSCKKNSTAPVDCFPNTATVRTITDKPATVKLTNGQYFLVEQGTIDTKLSPCNLSQDFQVDDLQVIISGEVKSTIRSGVGPCCTDNFVIGKITK